MNKYRFLILRFLVCFSLGILGVMQPWIVQAGEGAIDQPSPNSLVALLPRAEIFGENLRSQGQAQFDHADYPGAAASWQQAFEGDRAANNDKGMAQTLLSLAELDYTLSNYPQSLEKVAQAQAIATALGDQNLVALALFHQGRAEFARSNYSLAESKLQESLKMSQQLGDRYLEARNLVALGWLQNQLDRDEEAIKNLQAGREIFTSLGNQLGIVDSLAGLGFRAAANGNYARALAEFYQPSLELARQIGDRRGEASITSYIGSAKSRLGDPNQGETYFQQSLELSRAIGVPSIEARSLNYLGTMYNDRGNYPQALEFYQQSLTIRHRLGEKYLEAFLLNSIGIAYNRLGQQQRALESYNASLAIRREIGAEAGTAAVLQNMGFLYVELGENQRALELYQQAREITRRYNNTGLFATITSNISVIYTRLGDYVQAEALLREALAIHQAFGARFSQGAVLRNMGRNYIAWGKLDLAREPLQQALTIFRDLGNRRLTAETLGLLGDLLVQDQLPELAIIFYKQRVNTYESIRQELRNLPPSEQQAYADFIAGAYRTLADILLRQNRIGEAQQVLDLLKVQELESYLQNVQSSQGIDLLPQEQSVTQNYQVLQAEAIALGQELRTLRAIPPQERTPSQSQRIIELVAREDIVNQGFQRFANDRSVTTLTQEIIRRSGGENLNLGSLNQLRRQLQQLPQAVVLYPLVLDDRMELILVTADAPPINRTVQITKARLHRLIEEFLADLTSPRSRNSQGAAKRSAQQLYEILIKPLEGDLSIAKAQTIIFAPDGKLRYIPLAALYDGKNWLVEKYTVNNITAATLTNFSRSPSPSLSPILAGAFTEGQYNFRDGSREFSLNGLPFARKEVQDLANLLPSTRVLFDREFQPSAIIPILNNYRIVHLATHAAFVTGKPEDSFILFGNGDRLTLRDIEAWSLPNVDLFVLSACQTAVGGELGTGQEILGFGYQIQKAGARAAIASLWSVDDNSTQVLMDQFYHSLNNPQNIQRLGINTALREAQIAMIKQSNTLTQHQGERPKDFSHPYYWAPFILIGNGF